MIFDGSRLGIQPKNKKTSISIGRNGLENLFPMLRALGFFSEHVVPQCNV
jgi:hypothetical protein